MFIVGLLIVAGYSVNDTIVVFDRIRENVSRSPDRDLATMINLSIMESMGRSLNTSITTLVVLLAMLFIGGNSIRELLLVLAIGAVVGTYSSIFIASQYLVMWDRGEIGRNRWLALRAIPGLQQPVVCLPASTWPPVPPLLSKRQLRPRLGRRER